MHLVPITCNCKIFHESHPEVKICHEADASRLMLMLRRFRCAIILCDEGWIDPDLDTSNGIQIEEEGDLLRLDSMLLMVQLNVRSILEVSPITLLDPMPQSYL